MLHPFARRTGALVAGGALVASGLVLAPVGPASAIAPGEATSGSADWVEAQLTDGVVVNDQYDFEDIGLTIDAALALDAAGRDDAVTDIADAVSDPARLLGYIGDGVVEAYAGATAKAVVLAQAAGQDPTGFGGVDLVQRLEDRVLTDGPAAGRIQDQSLYGDYANVIGQAFAVRALDETDSDLTNLTTEHLLAQQCSAGYFRIELSAADAAEQSCEASGGAPDVDATAFAVRALAGQADDTDVEQAIAAAGEWLAGVQATDGSLVGNSTPNSNSTGLAAVALDLAGLDCPAGAAAGFVLGLRVTDPAAGSGLAEETGAIGYDRSATAAAADEGITEESQDQWRRATFQAMTALDVLAGLGDSGELETGGARYHKGGSSTGLSVAGVAEGDLVCLAGRGMPLQAVPAGVVEYPVQLPWRTKTASYFLHTQQGTQVGAFDVLGRLEIPFSVKKPTVAKGSRQVLKVSGLAAGEKVRAVFRGKKVFFGKANANGKKTVRFRVYGAPGIGKVRVGGEFAGIRKSTATFRVTR